MRYSLLILLLFVALALASCPQKNAGPAPMPKKTTAYSAELGIRITYDPADFSSISQDYRGEFPLYMSGNSYSLGVKRLANVGILLAKDPQADFFKFFAQQIRYDLITVGHLDPLEPEKDEEFTAQGKPGLRQTLHFRLPEKVDDVPGFLPKEPKAEVWVYYHHFYVKPDYYFFVAISRQALTQQQQDGIIALISAVQFSAQPLPENK
jgi:hypothetical protein